MHSKKKTVNANGRYQPLFKLIRTNVIKVVSKQ